MQHFQTLPTSFYGIATFEPCVLFRKIPYNIANFKMASKRISQSSERIRRFSSNEVIKYFENDDESVASSSDDENDIQIFVGAVLSMFESESDNTDAFPSSVDLFRAHIHRNSCRRSRSNRIRDPHIL